MAGGGGGLPLSAGMGCADAFTCPCGRPKIHGDRTSVAYSSSSVQGVSSSSTSVHGVPKLVHRKCTDWALAWAHVYISKQFPSLGTLSVTAWTQLVHICEQVSFQVGHSNIYSSVVGPVQLCSVSNSCLFITHNVL